MKDIFQKADKTTDFKIEYRQKLKVFFPDFLYEDLEIVLEIMP